MWKRSTLQANGKVACGVCVSLVRPWHGLAATEPRSLFSWTIAIAALSKSGEIRCARVAFDRMPMRDLYSWNVMLSGIDPSRDLSLAIELFDQMPERDTVSWNAMLSAFSQAGRLESAIELFFFQMPRRNVISWTTMIGALSDVESGDLAVDARMFFDRMPQRNVVSWTAMIHASACADRLEEARGLFDSMPARNLVTWNILLAGSGELSIETLDRIPAKDAVTLKTIMNWYCQAGRTGDAKSLFDRFPDRDVMSWTCLIQASAHHIDRAKLAFDLMPAWTAVSVNSMSSLFASQGDVIHAKELFDLAPERNVVSWTAVIQAFDRAGLPDSSQQAFDRMPARDEISWLAILAARSSNLQQLEDLFHQSPERSVLAWNALLSATARRAAGSSIPAAKAVFDRMPQHDAGSWNVLIDLEPELGTTTFFHSSLGKNSLSWEALLYGTARHGDHHRCTAVAHRMPALTTTSWNILLWSNARSGELVNLERTLRAMPEPDTVSMGTALAAYAHSGHVEAGILVFHEMLLDGLPPNEICFVNLLVACNHVGLVHEGRELLMGMAGDHGVLPGNEHFCCMVDILGKAGRLGCARELLENMPFEPDDVAWGSMFGACVLQDDVEGAKRALEEI